MSEVKFGWSVGGVVAVAILLAIIVLMKMDNTLTKHMAEKGLCFQQVNIINTNGPKWQWEKCDVNTDSETAQ